MAGCRLRDRSASCPSAGPACPGPAVYRPGQDPRGETQEADRARLGRAWADTGLVFTTKTGRPVEPRNLVRSFIRICDDNAVRRIRVHAVRHTTASLLKDLGVPARDAQIILGHAHVTTTQQIDTHVDETARRHAVTKLNELLGGAK